MTGRLILACLVFGLSGIACGGTSIVSQPSRPTDSVDTPWPQGWDLAMCKIEDDFVQLSEAGNELTLALSNDKAQIAAKALKATELLDSAAATLKDVPAWEPAVNLVTHTQAAIDANRHMVNLIVLAQEQSNPAYLQDAIEYSGIAERESAAANVSATTIRTRFDWAC